VKPYFSANPFRLKNEIRRLFLTDSSVFEFELKRNMRARIKPISGKLAAASRIYNERVKVWLVGKQCAVFHQLPATQCHHRFGRRGRLLLWEPGWLPVCDAGHALIHSTPKASITRGFIGPVGTWNDYERAKKYVEANEP